MTDDIKPQIGAFSRCTMCGCEIRFVGEHWMHVGEYQPRHPALPVGSVDVGAPPDEPAPDWTPNAKALREELAAYAHDAWAGWMRWMFQFCTETPGGGLTIPPEKVARWTRQMVTPYDRLPESERASDIAEAEKMMAILFKHGYRISED